MLSQNTFRQKEIVMIFLKIAIGLFITAWICANIYKTHCKSCREMYDELVAGQFLIGMIAANLFYAPSWILKVVKELIK